VPIRRIATNVSTAFTEAGQDTLERGSATMQMWQQPLSQSFRSPGASKAQLRRVRSAADVHGRELALPGAPRSPPGAHGSSWAPMETIPSQELHVAVPSRSAHRLQLPSVAAPSVGSPRQVSAHLLSNPRLGHAEVASGCALNP